MGATDPVACYLLQHASSIEVGWRRLASRTLNKLLSVAAASPQRREALANLRVCSMPTELCFSVPDGPAGHDDVDAVLEGIFRKTRCASRTVCTCCGRRARVRAIGEEETATLCAQCAAPRLLESDIWDLGQSTRFLMAVGMPICTSQIPPLLRPSFVQAAATSNAETSEPSMSKMPPTKFLMWAARWREIGETVRQDH